MLDDNRDRCLHNKVVNWIRPYVFAPLVFLILAGCEREHPSTEAARTFLDAVKYDDFPRAFSHHVLATEHSEFCTEAFARVIQATQKAATRQRCRDLESYSKAERRELSDEEDFAYQTLRAVCEEPDLDCEDYGRLVFESAWRRSTLPGTPYAVDRVLADGRSSAVYVRFSGGETAETRGTLRLEQHDGTWLVTGGLLDERGSQ